MPYTEGREYRLFEDITMDIRPLTHDLSVAPQIAADDVASIAARGFRAIVCNRPDREGADQPDFALIESAAQRAGLAVRYQPVVSGQVTDEHGREFGRLLASLPGPVLAYCRTGTRSTMLWALSEAGRLPAADILARAAAAGYDLASLAPRLRNGG